MTLIKYKTRKKSNQMLLQSQMKKLNQQQILQLIAAIQVVYLSKLYILILKKLMKVELLRLLIFQLNKK
ncbi:transmembrane protein, putative, partial (macronuclear) [Tetrahymena thermophila SB210]